MNKLFPDLPQALDNTLEIFSKVEPPKLKRDIILPNFPVSKEFKRPGRIPQSPVLKEQNDVMVNWIKLLLNDWNLNWKKIITWDEIFRVFFLIVQDFDLKAARAMGVRVGPVGPPWFSSSLLVLNITGLDPIK